MAGGPTAGTDDRYKWVALSNTTAAVFMSQLDGRVRVHYSTSATVPSV
jgi:hypothetical protein